jgi:hypothetical protein
LQQPLETAEAGPSQLGGFACPAAVEIDLLLAGFVPCENRL